MRTQPCILAAIVASSLIAGGFSTSEARPEALGPHRDVIAFDGEVDDADVVTAALAALDAGKDVYVFSERDGCTSDDTRVSNGVDLWNLAAVLDSRAEAASEPAAPFPDDGEEGEDLDPWIEEPLVNGKNPEVDEVADKRAATATSSPVTRPQSELFVYPGVTEKFLAAWGAELKPLLTGDRDDTVVIVAGCNSAAFFTTGAGKGLYY